MAGVPPVLTDQQIGHDSGPPILTDNQIGHQPAQPSGQSTTQAVGKKSSHVLNNFLNLMTLPFTYPPAAVQAALAIPQRAVSGLIGAQPGQNRLGAAGYEVTHPSQQAQFTHQLREKLPFINNLYGPAGTPALWGAVPPKAADIIRETGRDITAESITDPTMLLGGTGPVKGLGRTAARFIETGVPKILERSGPAGAQLARISQVAPLLKASTTPTGKAAVLTAENAAQTIAKQTADESLKVLEKNKAAIQSGQWPREVQQVFNRWRYIFGDEDTKKLALAGGYKPTAREQKLPTLNAMTVTKENYRPKVIQPEEKTPDLGIGLRTRRQVTPGFVKHQTGGSAEDQYQSAVAKISEYENTFRNSLANELTLQRVSPLPPDTTKTLRDLARARAAGNTAEVTRLQKTLVSQRGEFQQAQQALQKATAPGAQMVNLREYLAKNPAAYLSEAQYGPGLFRQAVRNINPEMKGTEIPFLGRGIDTSKPIGQMINDEIIPEYERLVERQLGRPLPKGVAQHRFGTQTQIGEIKALKNVSDATRLMLFMGFVRHGFFNVPFLQSIGPGGARAAVEGVARAVMSPNRINDIKRLEEMGAASHYIRQPEKGAGPLMRGLTKLATPATRITERADMSQRIALMSYLDRAKEYRNLEDWEKGQIINDTLFDYNHQSDLSKLLRGYTGAQFPHWRLTMVTHAAKAMVQNPAMVDAITKAQVDLNRNLGYDIDFATPLDTGVKAYGFPIGTAKFAKGTIPAAATGYDVLSAKKGKQGQALLNDLIYYFTPAGLGGLLQQKLGTSPFKQYGPEELRTLLELGTGTHTSRKQVGY